ncbi:MAG: GAF domain-containing sensor histidine kinase [Geothrix sp.]|uniref:sensor histidine kinase n=1 Tax=Geothrix sp. TaxID=1962974 RepID=UPI0017DA62C9|nr:GAF domain-containing sensor histidine kinase [Geothrix sp.]NWJ42542.1 GAF domain-containing sensor histidine kinase [Geothrix sp.]WIL19497.1 MAG: GAF domain-containing sensor histidine kinase [Geothrix sp.]
MSANGGPLPGQARPDISPRHGFTESHTENMLRDSLLIAAALAGGPAALIMQDESGTWYRDSCGLTTEQAASLEPALSRGSGFDPEARGHGAQGLQLAAALPLVDDCRRALGTLCVLSQGPPSLSEDQREALRLVAEHVQTIVTMDRQRSESRATLRAPAAASFVPGLVHELGSFIFGISASLDALEARYTGLEDVGRYAANIRKGLDRMGTFIVELKEYGYPQRLSWTVLDLEPLLREAVERNAPLAAKQGIDLQFHSEGALPRIQADGEGLQAALIRLIDLILQQEQPGGRVVLNLAAAHQGNRGLIAGNLDFPGTKMKQVDPARIFEPFYYRMSGLGRLTLPGARRIFESHGGSLTAGPGPEGGMRISFMLPSE